MAATELPGNAENFLTSAFLLHQQRESSVCLLAENSRLYVVYLLYRAHLSEYFDSLSYPLLYRFWHFYFTECGLLLCLSFQEPA